MTLEKISKRFIERHPIDAVRIIEQLADTEKSALISSIAPETAAHVLQAMTPSDAVTAISLITPLESVAILANVSPNLAAACLRRVPDELRRSILKQAEDNGDLTNVRTLLQFPVGVIGAIMDPEAVAIQEQMTVKEAVAYLRRYPAKLQNIIYVINNDNALTGLVEAKDLLVSTERASVKTSMKPVQYRLNARAHLVTSVDNPGWEHLSCMPVVDYHGIFLGSVAKDSFLNALADIDTEETYGDQPKDILIGLAETFLNTCSELLFPNKK